MTETAIEPRTEKTALGAEPTGIASPSAELLFGTADPASIVERSVHVADVLMRVVHDRGLVFQFSGRDWYGAATYQLLGAFFGIRSELEWTRRLPDGSGWEARSLVRAGDGSLLGSGEAMVTRDERNWSKAPEHSVRAMAQTRAQRRALQSVLGFVVQVAGYDAAMPDAPATRAQVVALHTLAAEHGWDDVERHRRAGVESFNDLSRAEAGELLEAWGITDDTGLLARVDDDVDEDRTRASAAIPPETLEEAWVRAVGVFGSKAGVLRAVFERWPSDGGITIPGVTLEQLQTLIAGGDGS